MCGWAYCAGAGRPRRWLWVVFHLATAHGVCLPALLVAMLVRGAHALTDAAARRNLQIKTHASSAPRRLYLVAISASLAAALMLQWRMCSGVANARLATLDAKSQMEIHLLSIRCAGANASPAMRCVRRPLRTMQNASVVQRAPRMQPQPRHASAPLAHRTPSPLTHGPRGRRTPTRRHRCDDRAPTPLDSTPPRRQIKMAAMMDLERTYIMIKPDGVQRGLIGDIVKRFEQKGFKLVAASSTRPSQAHFEKHYEDLKGKKFFPP